ncbi:hypothetical protein Dsin_009841 [Dipteronia sinensis]|uniref:Uncharacterized protein n=1 Tax=Dipteronia sinensis TaxID=43782 RepID=A0AAE0EC41_9ROSI|nr:hypothetical protein Dsin_009841 [Dipteronia sinensis]
MLDMVVADVSIQRDADIVPAVHDGGDHMADAGPLHMRDVVVAAISIQRDVDVVFAVRNRGDHRANARPAGPETAEGRVDDEVVVAENQFFIDD